QPFEFFGAPWVDARKLAAALNTMNMPGVRFVPIDFTPTASKFKGEMCHGCYVIVVDRNAIRPVRMGVGIVWQLHQLFGEKFEIDKVNKLLDSDKTLAAIKSAKEPATIPAVWEKELAAFKKTRKKYLIYQSR